MRDTQFRQWWGGPHTPHRIVGGKTFHHPVAGTLTLDWDTFPCGTDQTLGVWTVEPGTPCHDGLHILGSWKASSTADRDPDAGKLP
jgi:hypothetical protein